MNNDRFWEYVEHVKEGGPFDVTRVFDRVPQDEWQDFVDRFDYLSGKILNASGFCADSATDGSYGIVAAGREEYEDLEDKMLDNPDKYGEKMCEYSYTEHVAGRSAEMLGYQINALRRLFTDPYWADTPDEMLRLFAKEKPEHVRAKLLPLFHELWNEHVRPHVDTREKYQELAKKNYRKGYRESSDDFAARINEAWDNKIAALVGAAVPVKKYLVTMRKETVEVCEVVVEAKTHQEVLERLDAIREIVGEQGKWTSDTTERKPDVRTTSDWKEASLIFKDDNTVQVVE